MKARNVILILLKEFRTSCRLKIIFFFFLVLVSADVLVVPYCFILAKVERYTYAFYTCKTIDFAYFKVKVHSRQ